MRATLLILLGLIPALAAIAQAPPTIVLPPRQEGTSTGQAKPQPESGAQEAARQRKEAIERCKAERGTDCDTSAGAAEFRDRVQPDPEGPRTVDQQAPAPTARPAK